MTSYYTREALGNIAVIGSIFGLVGAMVLDQVEQAILRRLHPRPYDHEKDGI